MCKEDLFNPELFFEVGFSVIEKVALKEVKPEGKKIKVTKKIKEYFDIY